MLGNIRFTHYWWFPTISNAREIVENYFFLWLLRPFSTSPANFIKISYKLTELQLHFFLGLYISPLYHHIWVSHYPDVQTTWANTSHNVIFSRTGRERRDTFKWTAQFLSVSLISLASALYVCKLCTKVVSSKLEKTHCKHDEGTAFFRWKGWRYSRRQFLVPPHN